jgi:hypothetical protein
MRPVIEGEEGRLDMIYSSSFGRYDIFHSHIIGNQELSGPTKIVKKLAVNNEHEVQPNDIILISVDNMFANLFSDNVLDCILPHMKGAILLNINKATSCIVK